MKFFNLLLLSGLSATLLISCDTKRSSYVGDDDAQFNVGSISLVSAAVTGKINNLPSKRLFILRACVHSLSGGPIPMDLEFQIQAGSESVTRKTDKDSCFSWNEDRSFDPTPTKGKRYIELNRTFVAKNEYAGKRPVRILLNPWTTEVIDTRQTGNVDPQKVEPTTTDGFHGQVVEQTTATTPTIAGTSPGIDPTNLSDSSLRMSVANLELGRVDTAQDPPYKLDTDLNLSVGQTYRFKATPKFFIKSFDSDDEEISPSKGRFKVTLAFMDMPQFEVEKLVKILENSKTLSEAIQLANKETNRELIATTNKSPEATILSDFSKDFQTPANANLNALMRRKLIAQSLAPFVQQTVEFETEMNAQFGLSEEIKVAFKNLAMMNTQALIAVTIQPIDELARPGIKADGVGYIKSFLNPGSAELFPLIGLKVEADLIHAERKLMEAKQAKLSPLELYFSTSLVNDKEQAFKPIDKSDLPKNYVTATFRRYNFSEQLEKYLNGQLRNTPYRTDEIEFLRALCYKAYVSEPALISSAAAANASVGLSMAIYCSNNPMNHFNLKTYDFVESLPTGKATKTGQTLEQKFDISKSFKKSAAVGHSFDAKVSIAGDVDMLKVSIGHSWYYTYSSDESVAVSSDVSFGINVQITNFEFDAVTRRCLIVEFQPEMMKHFKKYNLQMPKGFVTCSQKTKLATRSQDYFIVSQSCVSDSPLTNCASAQENQFRMVIRGKETFSVFEKMIKNSKLNFFLSPLSDEYLRTELQRWGTRVNSFKTSQIYPGVLLPQ